MSICAFSLSKRLVVTTYPSLSANLHRKCRQAFQWSSKNNEDVLKNENGPLLEKKNVDYIIIECRLKSYNICLSPDLLLVAFGGLGCRYYQKFMRIAFGHFWRECLETNRTGPTKLLEVCIIYRIGQGGQKDGWNSLCIKVLFSELTFM